MAGAGAVKEPPRSRYRVVERGRRLEVIDTQRPGASAPPADPQRPPLLAKLPRRTAFDGSARLTTASFYDDKAPRTIALDPTSATIVRWTGIGAIILVIAYIAAACVWPWLFAAIPLFIDKRMREPMRRAATRWLDRVEREAG